MDIIETITAIVDILNKHPNLHLIDCDVTKGGSHVKVERWPEKPKKEEIDHADKSFI